MSLSLEYSDWLGLSPLAVIHSILLWFRQSTWNEQCTTVIQWALSHQATMSSVTASSSELCHRRQQRAMSQQATMKAEARIHNDSVLYRHKDIVNEQLLWEKKHYHVNLWNGNNTFLALLVLSGKTNRQMSVQSLWDINFEILFSKMVFPYYIILCLKRLSVFKVVRLLTN